MKTRQLTTFILDQNKDEGLKFSSTINGHFAKIFCHYDPDASLKEYLALRPQVLFVNLDVSQRMSNIELVEKILLSPGDAPSVILGYSETNEPELMGHALENGLQGVLVKPYDSDTIISRVNRILSMERHGEQYTKLRTPMKATVTFAARLVAVDESGFTFKSAHFLAKGTEVPLKNALIKSIFDADGMDFIITKTWLSPDWMENFFYAEPKQATEATSTALRSSS